jgi:hypothetical protein
MKLFTGIYVVAGAVRRMTFEAESPQEAQKLAAPWGVGVEGETQVLAEAETTLPEAYDLKTTCRLLGNISPSTIYREVAVGGLERVPNSRRILITRKSIESRCRLKRRPGSPF